MKREEIAKLVIGLSTQRKGLKLFEDNYKVKGGYNKRLKFSGLYIDEEGMEKLQSDLLGEIMVCNEGKESESRWEITKVYRRRTAEDLNLRWRNDSEVVCIVLKKVS